MHPRLMKLTIPKCTLATRQRVQSWLSAQGKDALMPTVRVTSDAMRVATSYVLRDWAHWQGKDGTVYKATSVALTHPKGLSCIFTSKVAGRQACSPSKPSAHSGPRMAPPPAYCP